MKNDQVTNAMREAMHSVHVSPRLRARTLYAMRGKQERSYQMKRKISVVMACALIGVMLVTVALAVANHTGVLDFINMYDVTLPENATDYVQTDVASAESDGLHAAVREAIYDGRRLRMVVDLRMDGEKPLLTAMDCSLNDPFAWLRRDGSEDGSRTVLDAYRADGYTDLYYLATSISDGPEEGTIDSYSGDYMLQEDGALTCYYEICFAEDLPQRSLTFSAQALPYVEADGETQPDSGANGDSAADNAPDNAAVEEEIGMQLDRDHPRAKVDVSFDLAATEITEERYVSDAPVEYESVGVRVDRITMTVKALEIDYVISYTITDLDKYAVTDEGLWFEFIDPNSTETDYYAQRLKAGSSNLDAAGNADLTQVQEQSGTLALSEKADTYTMRAYECWNKQRFETHEIHMVKAE